MTKTPGRPKQVRTLDEYLEIRVGKEEKKAFRDAAELAGIPLATWVRERLRRASIRELEEGSLPVAFLRRAG